MLYHTIRAPEAGVFLVQCSAVLNGALDRAVLARAWQLATARHAALRTFFSWEGRERPLQVVRSNVEVDLAVEDWQLLATDDQEAAWERRMKQDRGRGLELATAPLMRLLLVQVAPTRHRLLWSMHHALVDGWSALIVLDEVLRDYAILSQGAEPVTAVAPRFDRFVGWLEAQDRERDAQYWQQTLAGFVVATPLPGGRVPEREVGARSHARAILSHEDTRALQTAAASHRVTINTLLMGAWAGLLARHAGEDDVTLGVTVSERPPMIDGIQRAVGLYLSTIPLRVPTQAGATLGPWLRDLQRGLSEARDHAAPGLAAIQRWAHATSTTPLFRNLVVFENFPETTLRAFTGDGQPADPTDAGVVLTAATMDVPNDVPLVLLALPGERLSLDIVYDPAAVPTPIAERLPAQLVRLLAELGGDSQRPVFELTMLPDLEREQLEETFSGAAQPGAAAVDVIDRFALQVKSRGDAIALMTETTAVSYAALDRQANRLAQRLAAAGVETDALVGVLADRSSDAVAAMLAILKHGAAYVPLDPATPSARLEQMLRSLSAALVAPHLATRLPTTVRSLLLDDAASSPDTPPPPSGDSTRVAYVIFTSGSTGEPKGVVVERRHLAASTGARDQYYPEPPRTFVLLSSLAVDSSVAGIFWTLSTGGTLVLPAARAEQDVEGLARLVARTSATHVLLVPSLHRTMLELADLQQLSSLRCVIVAGEACPADVVRLHHECLPSAILHNEYGPSEATVWATAGVLAPEEPVVTIGRPVPGARIYLLDPQHRLVPLGSVGELCIGGPWVARGYLERPDETTRRFVPDPFVPEGRLYCTGDLARFLPDGRLEFLGRRDEQLKIRGFRVEPAEVERALASFPAVREAAVALVRPAPDDDPERLAAALADLSPDDAERLLQAVESHP
jgi:amino acid adenylation domain-containing protein